MVPSDATVTQPDPTRAPAREAAPIAEPTPRNRPFLRIAVILVASTGTLLLLSAILDDVHVTGAAAALGASVLIGLLSALLWPLVICCALPIPVLPLGLGVIALNGAVVLRVGAISPGLPVDSLFAGVVVAPSLTVVTPAVASLLATDEDVF